MPNIRHDMSYTDIGNYMIFIPQILIKCRKAYNLQTRHIQLLLLLKTSSLNTPKELNEVLQISVSPTYKLLKELRLKGYVNQTKLCPYCPSVYTLTRSGRNIATRIVHQYQEYSTEYLLNFNN